MQSFLLVSYPFLTAARKDEILGKQANMWLMGTLEVNPKGEEHKDCP